LTIEPGLFEARKGGEKYIVHESGECMLVGESRAGYSRFSTSTTCRTRTRTRTKKEIRIELVGFDNDCRSDHDGGGEACEGGVDG
jgi:hypothetical protein